MKNKITLDILVNYRSVVLMILFLGSLLFTGSDLYGYSGLSNTLKSPNNSELITYSSNLEEVQNHRITGTVLDENGVPLLGATVLEQGTRSGTVTDFDGNFTLTVSGSNATIIVSFVGFVTQEVAVDGRNTLTVTLAGDATGLDEVVVMGYGIQKKSDVTGAVTRLDAEDFRSQPITQVSDMLAGTVAGFYGNQATGAEGGASIEVRGPTSLTGGTEPLIVLDGAIFHGNMADINPNDIATIDVLKDASSAAVYGAKAASGVILITTTKGVTGEPVINFNVKAGVNSVTNSSFRPHDAQGYLDFRRDFYRTLEANDALPDYYWNDPNNLPNGVTVDDWLNLSNNPNSDVTQEYLGRLNFFETEREVYLSGETMDWFDEVIQAGIRQDYDASVRGGSENFHYYYSLGYVENKGLIRGDEFQAIRSRLNLDFDVTNWLTIGTNAQFSIRDNSTVPASLDISALSPFSKKYEEDGSVKWFPNDYPGGRNPLINHLHQDRLNKNTGIFATIFAKVALPFGIEYELSFQPRFEFDKNYNFWGEQTIVGGQDRNNGYGTRSDFSLNAWMVDNILRWNKEIGVHRFDATLLYNAEQTKTYRSSLSNENFNPNQTLGFHGIEFGSKPSVSSTDTQSGANAVMARVNYTLMDRYLFTGSVRRDGYSAFGGENNKATFPAAAVGWRISEEEFFTSDVVSNLKLRLSWGINGNRDIGIYSALAQISSVLYYDGTNVQTGLGTSSLANNQLQWEKTEAYNLGLDMSLFNNRIDLSAEFYSMTTTDLLMSRQLPAITGFERIMSNLGELQNRGMDLTLNTVNVSNPDVVWRSSFIYSMNRNKIVSLFGDTEEVEINGQTITREVPDYSNEWFPGEAIDVVWDYDLAGVWQLDEAEQAAEYGMIPGDFKAVDVNNDGEYDQLVDKQFIGHTRPRHRLGLKNEVTFFQNFSASVFVRADLGHIREFSAATHEYSTYDRRNYWNIPYWTPTNGENEYARLNENRTNYGGDLRVFKPTSFVRVQNVSLSYDFPADLTEKLRMNDFRIFASVQNALTFTNWPGWDPESGNSPMPQTYTIGLNLGL